MKLVYQNNGYKVYTKMIAGYHCQIHETKSGLVSVSVPMGKTKADKDMFDKLVYFNQKVYNGDDKKEVIAKVRKFIKTYKLIK